MMKLETMSSTIEIEELEKSFAVRTLIEDLRRVTKFIVKDREVADVKRFIAAMDNELSIYRNVPLSVLTQKEVRSIIHQIRIVFSEYARKFFKTLGKSFMPAAIDKLCVVKKVENLTTEQADDIFKRFCMFYSN